MFEYCALKDKKCCPYATTYKGHTHCGLQTGNQQQNKIMYMRKCPLDTKKKKIVYFTIQMELERATNHARVVI